ncbi:hypothetical protein [Phenylobacterium sp.]|uniref:hypothetical protein n=1 Tax=Phenylobacterium sp. TaxID=1871053 RepID=UPI0035B0DDC9
MQRVLRALALSTLILSPAAGAAAAAQAPAPDAAEAEDLQGTVGVCVRWGADPTRLAEVVVVRPSGDARVDALAASTLRNMPFPKPAGDAGGWRAISMGVGGSEPLEEAPDCGGLSSSVADEEPLFTRPLPKQTAA